MVAWGPWRADGPVPDSQASDSVPAQSSLPDGLFLVWGEHGAFADDEHGYILLGRCETEPCETWVGATADGGRTWHAALVPGLTFPGDVQVLMPRARLHVLGAQRAVLEGFDSQPFGGPDHRRWHTADGGRTWVEAPVMPVETVDSIPEDSYVYAAIPPDPQAPGHVLRIIRNDGSSAILATAPGDLGVMPNVRHGLDGSYWITGSVSAVRSLDQGRTWSVVPYPDGAAEYSIEIYPGDGTARYAIWSGMFRVWRSTDDGANWTELDVPFDNEGTEMSLSWNGSPTGELILYRFLLSGPEPLRGHILDYYRLSESGAGFERIDFDGDGWYSSGPVPSVVAETPRAQFAGGPYGVLAVDGSWIPLPFPCRPENCRG